MTFDAEETNSETSSSSAKDKSHGFDPESGVVAFDNLPTASRSQSRRKAREFRNSKLEGKVKNKCYNPKDVFNNKLWAKDNEDRKNIKEEFVVRSLSNY